MATRIKRIGILGGTFNPVHIGHLLVAQDALDQLRLDSVKFVPSALPPHKNYEGNATAAQRLAMVRLAVHGNPRFEVDDIEVRRGGTSYSVDTVTELRRQEPSARFYFIIGADSLQELHRWREVERLLRLCTFVTAARPGVGRLVALDRNRRRGGVGEQSGWSTSLQRKLGPVQLRKLHRHVLRGHACDVASRDIRARVARGVSIRYLVPDEVLRYIGRHQLYR